MIIEVDTILDMNGELNEIVVLEIQALLLNDVKNIIHKKKIMKLVINKPKKQLSNFESCFLFYINR
jgi:hypothetical protein